MDADGFITLNLSDNDLSGGIPPELGNLTNLEWLYLDRNDLSGGIPPALANLNNLTTALISGNRLTGCYPAVWDYVSDNDLADSGLRSCE